MARVQLVDLRKTFGAVQAVSRANVVFEEGSFTTLLGPSGCGKTTILRMVSGLETPTSGDILIGDKRINDVPIHKRNLGLVFQNYALFPHRTIGENIAFGLKYRDVPKEDVARKIKESLDIVRLPGVEDRYPSQLSGGQQQRIALARAIVIEPDVLLLDEPLSALDANLREDMRVELKAIQDRIGVTSIFVTHDQSEALAMSDKIIVMSAGQVEQIGTPEEVYNRPASAFVARFLGASNLLDAQVVGRDKNHVVLETPEFGKTAVPLSHAATLGQAERAKLMIRAEKLTLGPKGNSGAEAVVETVDYQGQLARYFLRVGDTQMQAMNMIDEKPFLAGETVSLSLNPNACSALPEDKQE
ncbi:Spermidine/putrescine import ATP-binding protein PotA [Roseovarius litorisediminis]|uniref:Spermidine/putrescine import ATP-binding protein PotA n=1 Tax=Roseovarius litorisediminis TaxID=1312363 RepID=A0A1Y5TL09_9RHOB|nr:ABC transporter ATP-binding protein [Roseovarius litorisediminis]SLN66549.1 Spermidine/putrescine import ATP-binding protein PotA [Roseovarius litorisediminis]